MSFVHIWREKKQNTTESISGTVHRSAPRGCRGRREDTVTVIIVATEASCDVTAKPARNGTEGRHV